MGSIWNVWRQTTPFFYLESQTPYLPVHHFLAFIVALRRFFFSCRVLVSKLVSQTIQVVSSIRSLVSALLPLFILYNYGLLEGFVLCLKCPLRLPVVSIRDPHPINLKILNAVFYFQGKRSLSEKLKLKDIFLILKFGVYCNFLSLSIIITVYDNHTCSGIVWVCEIGDCQGPDTSGVGENQEC